MTPVFENFTASALEYLSGTKPDPSVSPRFQVETLLKLLHYPGTLLVLDGFERALRA